MSLSEKIQEINREISATVEKALSDLRREVAERVRASSEEIARHVEELTPQLPASFLAHEDLGPVAETMAREAAEKASREARDRADRAERTGRDHTERSRLLEQRAAGAGRSAAADLRDAVAAVDRARSQAEILAALLREAGGRFAGRAAVLLVRGGEMRGWAGQGFGDADATLRDFGFTPTADGGWSRLGQTAVHLSAADCAELCGRIEAPLPHEGVLIPIVLRDRVAAGLYADRAEGLPAVEALQVLCYSAAQAIELLPFRERAATATLAAEPGLAPAPLPEIPEAPAAPETAAPAAESPAAEGTESFATARTAAIPREELPDYGAAPEVAEIAVEEAAEVQELPEIEEIEEIEVEAEPEAAAPPSLETLSEAPSPWQAAAPEPDTYEIEEEIEALPELPDMPEEEIEALPELPDMPEEPPAAQIPRPEPSPAATVFQPIPAELRGLGAMSSSTPEVPPAARMTAPLPLPQVAPEANPDATVLLQRPSLRETPPPLPPQASPQASPQAPPPAPTPLRSVPPPLPVPAPEPAAAEPASLSGIPEVRPPSGVEGPGWAFATTRVAVSPSDEAQHEEARRLARLLVSEIKLYNEEQVEEGRRRRDVYERLKEDIDRSRQMYEERVEPRILKSTDYFYQELVRILAAGDAKALGI